jgi:hypothetical protein
VQRKLEKEGSFLQGFCQGTSAASWLLQLPFPLHHHHVATITMITTVHEKNSTPQNLHNLS